MKVFIRDAYHEDLNMPRVEISVDHIGSICVTEHEPGAWAVVAKVQVGAGCTTTRLSPAYRNADEAMLALNAMRNAMGHICHDIAWPEPSTAD